MKHILFSLIVLISIVSATQAGSTDLSHPQGNLTLENACRITLENNPGIEQARQRILAATAVLKQAKSAWKPLISAKGGAKAMDVTVQPDWAQTTRISDDYADWSAGISFSWLIFDGFAREATILSSNFRVKHSEQILSNYQTTSIESCVNGIFTGPVDRGNHDHCPAESRI